MHSHIPRLCAFVFAAMAMTLACEAVFAAEIRRGLGPEPDSLHIHQAQGLPAVNLLREIREGLVSFDQQGELVPGQAESWSVSEAGRLYRFQLRQDARWSNGDPVTADDFVRAWHRAFTPETAATTAGLLKNIVNAEKVLRGEEPVEALGIRTVTPDVLEISLVEPAPWILEILAHPVSFPLHKEAEDDPLHAPVNGAFMIAEWTPRASIKLARNPEFHAAESVRVQSIEYFPIDDAAAELSRYRAGELDITETIPAGRYAWLTENLGTDLKVHPYLGTFWLGFNFHHPALGHSAALRTALSLAIDREILTRVVIGAGELPAWSIVPPGISGYQPAVMAQSRMSQEAREEEARRLFEQSGFGRNEPLLLELRYNTSGVNRRLAVAVSAMWKQVLGVNTQLVNEEWKVFVNNRRLGVVTEVFRGGWIADYADPSSFLDLFLSGNSLNNTFYNGADFELLMKSAALTVNETRLELLQRAEAQLLKDMPVIPLYYYVSRHLVRQRITGFSVNIRDVHLSRYLGVATETP